MKLIYNVSNTMKDFELRQDPVIARVNEFTEQAAEKLSTDISAAHNTGQDIPWFLGNKRLRREEERAGTSDKTRHHGWF